MKELFIKQVATHNGLLLGVGADGIVYTFDFVTGLWAALPNQVTEPEAKAAAPGA